MGYDLVIKNGTVVDGSGGAGYHADIGIKDGRIVAVGRITSPTGALPETLLRGRVPA